MAAATGLHLKARGNQRLSRDMMQGMAILARPAATLRAELEAAMLENPALDLAEPMAQGFGDGATDRIRADPDLGSLLRDQLRLERLPQAVLRAARTITWALDDRGWLDMDLAEIASLADTSPEEAAAGLAAVQACQPAGVAARDLPECLALQLVAGGEDPSVARAAAACLPDLVAGHWKRASDTSGLDIGTLKRLAALLPALTAAPGAGFGAAARALLPDLVVRVEADGTLTVGLKRGVLPNLRLHPGLPDDGRLAEARREAEGLIRALSFRRSTLLRVGAAVAEHQRAWLTGAADALGPLERQTVAAELGLHPSTVGRAVQDKAIDTPHGVLPLSALFPGTLDRSGDGPSVHAVQQRIARLIAAETGGRVLSDSEIAARLSEEGVDIARRTVAKYRGCLSIPPSHVRKRRKALRSLGGEPVGV